MLIMGVSGKDGLEHTMQVTITLDEDKAQVISQGLLRLAAILETDASHHEDHVYTAIIEEVEDLMSAQGYVRAALEEIVTKRNRDNAQRNIEAVHNLLD